ncbi:hypothetical protein VC83_02138 [Pseudogymnoascus destructans]|uniref:Extracellular mutant protein 11 C-terminal domain-containing protein n=2 Tax=Pseudogymnoascus destructans TaxID=655981 RepID=L8G2W7_PSED2|nr:uncharacterized protein VC83_02138 [Pseudogymnoascus destructans]ELR07482.1 hypothetical protein GMDG_02574 [Pseudogymnoascus destructans 20631-21]OAF61502.1 hypothetical protein VC83_02138 [Pseudogymnoascus destructans]
MAGGVQGFVNKKHQQYGGNENEAAATEAQLQQRKAAVRELGLKAPGPAAGWRSQSISGPGVPFRDAVTDTARAGSLLAMQQAGAQDGFATQGRNQINGQGQAYTQKEPQSLWAESSLGSDSMFTVRDGPPGHLYSDDELEDTQGRHVEGQDQNVGLSDQRSDSDPEEEEVDQNIAGYHNANPRQPGLNQANIPMRGVNTRRFESKQQQRPVTETAPSIGKRAANGSGKNYNQKNMSGRLGHQVQEDGGQQQEVDAFAPSEVDEDTMHSIDGNGGKQPRKGSKRQADDISSVDFDQETLFNMSYADLKKQPFDEDPNQAENPSLTGLPKSLDARMKLFKYAPAENQLAFLATLSIDEWEEAGEWLMKQFGTVMDKFADARRERRKIATGFEDRLAARDAEVREKTDGVTAALKDFKKGGQELLRRKTPT